MNSVVNRNGDLTTSNQHYLRKVTASDEIHAVNCTFNKGVKSTSGGIHFENSKAQKIVANGQIYCKGSNIYRKVKSQLEDVTFENSNARKIEAGKYIDVSGNSKIEGKVESQLEDVLVSSSQAGSVKAKTWVWLVRGSTVDGEVESQMCSVLVHSSKAKSIIAGGKIKLVDSQADKLLIKAVYNKYLGRHVARLVMNNAIVNGDITVKVSQTPQQERGGCEFTLFNGFAGGQSTFRFADEGSARNCSFENTRSLFLRVMDEGRIFEKQPAKFDSRPGEHPPLRWRFTLEGFSYPLTSSDMRVIEKNRENLGLNVEISEDGRIENTHGNIIKIGDEEFGREETDEPVDNQESCTLMIEGTGSLKGRVKFIGCTGTVKADDGITFNAL